MLIPCYGQLCIFTSAACQQEDDGLTASFGYRDVPESEKAQLVRGVFSSVARRYDLMNDLMSGGVHRLWKDALVDWLNPQANQTIADIAGGTGDVAFRIAERARRRGGHADVIVCDINAQMIAEGQRRAAARHEPDVKWSAGDAEHQPFADASLDACTIAFGIRNVTNIEAALAEVQRVLRPGGRFLCLEFSRVQAPGLDALYERYSFSVLPRLGEWVAKDGEAYRYLVESIRRFPAQAAFAKMIARAGLSRVKFRNLAGGIAALHSAWRL
jgi:demethylmenaquinone methyltransferase/2-methoxy-6-polyprenyl-1,4-benzoquinol methylase